MRDEEIMERARRARTCFRDEVRRLDRTSREPALVNLVIGYGYIAGCVAMGEYHREGIFKDMAWDLRRLGVDVSGLDTETGPRSSSVREAARNASSDTLDLYRCVSVAQPFGNPLLSVVDAADDLVRAVRYDCYLDPWCGRFRDAVSRYLADHGIETDDSCAAFESAAHLVLARDPVAEGPARETPGRVIFNPPATIAFWPDGTKTVAKCAEGEAFSEYTGLLVCIAKRHLEVPRHAMFEDAMAKLLRKAERRGGR